MDPERTPKKTPPLHSNSNIYRKCRCPQNGPQRKRPRSIATAHCCLATHKQTRTAGRPASQIRFYIYRLIKNGMLLKKVEQNSRLQLCKTNASTHVQLLFSRFRVFSNMPYAMIISFTDTGSQTMKYLYFLRVNIQAIIYRITPVNHHPSLVASRFGVNPAFSCLLYISYDLYRTMYVRIIIIALSRSSGMNVCHWNKLSPW
jgi:hypothetical protein